MQLDPSCPDRSRPRKMTFLFADLDPTNVEGRGRSLLFALPRDTVLLAPHEDDGSSSRYGARANIQTVICDRFSLRVVLGMRCLGFFLHSCAVISAMKEMLTDPSDTTVGQSISRWLSGFFFLTVINFYWGWVLYGMLVAYTAKLVAMMKAGGGILTKSKYRVFCILLLTKCKGVKLDSGFMRDS